MHRHEDQPYDTMQQFRPYEHCPVSIQIGIVSMFHENSVLMDWQQAKLLRNTSPLGFLLLSSRSSFRMVTFRKKSDSKYRSDVITRNFSVKKKGIFMKHLTK